MKKQPTIGIGKTYKDQRIGWTPTQISRNKCNVVLCVYVWWTACTGQYYSGWVISVDQYYCVFHNQFYDTSSIYISPLVLLTIVYFSDDPLAPTAPTEPLAPLVSQDQTESEGYKLEMSSCFKCFPNFCRFRDMHQFLQLSEMWVDAYRGWAGLLQSQEISCQHASRRLRDPAWRLRDDYQQGDTL